MEAIVVAAEIVVGTLLNALKESIQLQQSRGLDLKRAASGDTYQVPELKLNFCMISELFVQILATGFGVLAFVWATAVLLGGFSNDIPREDFWVVTAIVFIQAARVVGLNVSPQADFFSQVPLAFLVFGATFGGWVRIIMASLSKLVLAVKLVAGAVCISFSIYRLVALSRHHENTFVFHTLILLYALVLLQGLFFIIWLWLRLYRSDLANHVILKYGLEDKRGLIDKYMDKTMSTAIQSGLTSTIIRNLASFAADLMKSDYSHDHIDAVLMIHTLTSQEDHRTRTLSQIQSSPLCVSRLLDMFTSKSHIDQRIKICIAEILVHLASNLRLANISGATESISSMIDPYFTKISKPTTNANIGHQTAIGITIDQQGAIQSDSATNGAENIGLRISIKQLMKRKKKIRAEIIRNRQQEALRSSNTTSGVESKPLIIHGLLILAKLAVNPDNCKQIYDSMGLFSKIISPVKNRVYKIPDGDGVSITEKALEVLIMLVSGTHEINGKIRQYICRNGIAVIDIHPILQSMYTKLKVPAAIILAELYLDVSTRDTIGLDNIAVYIEVLMNIFFDAENERRLRETAGTALAGLAMDNANCMTIINFSNGRGTSVQLLIALIPREDDRLYRTAIAQLLMQLCANSDPGAGRPRLMSVKTILHEVFKVICNLEQATHANQAGSAQDNPDQQQAANENQAGSPQHNPGQQQAAIANQAGSPQHNFPAVAQLVGDRRKSLAAFLGLGLQICEKLNTSTADFDATLANIHLTMGEFVDKLNDIIEQCKGHSADSLEGKAPSVDYLIIIKTVAKLCTWMMRSKPDCITEFQNKNTSTKLQGALEDMRELELGMLLTGKAGDMANYQTLSAVVGAARQEMDANVQF